MEEHTKSNQQRVLKIFSHNGEILRVPKFQLPGLAVRQVGAGSRGQLLCISLTKMQELCALSGCHAASSGCLDLCGKGPNVKVPELAVRWRSLAKVQTAKAGAEMRVRWLLVGLLFVGCDSG